MLLYELRKYQTTALPLATWLERPSRLYQKQHVHDCYEMVVVRTGTGWSAVNGLRFPMLRYDLYVLRPGDLHEFTNNQGMRFYNLMFSDTLFTQEETEVFLPLLKWHGKYTLPCAVFDRVDVLLAELSSELKNRQPGNAVAARAIFLRFLVELLRIPTPDMIVPRNGKDSFMASRILELITRRCRGKLTLNDLARETGGSPEYAGRRFKNLTGITFTDYLTQYRIDLACGKLENTGASISEIAAELGYFDTAYFDKCFRKVLGMSPQTYRRQFARIASDSRSAEKASR